MKTLGTLHSNYTHVVACLRKGVLGSLRYRFAIVFMPCASWKTMWHDNAAAQGYSGPSPSTSVQAYTTSRIFCFLIVLQGIEHAFRKTDMRILISYMGGFYTLSIDISTYHPPLSILLGKGHCHYIHEQAWLGDEGHSPERGIPQLLFKTILLLHVTKYQGVR